jgi:predicted nucleic acid-binding protein
MPGKSSLVLVINSSPLVALTAALPDFQALAQIVERFIVPAEVLKELAAGHLKDDTAALVQATAWCEIRPPRPKTPLASYATLGVGETAVIETALEENWPKVAIDELRGRRFARLCGLQVIGSLGIIVEAYRAGLVSSVDTVVSRMKAKGIFLSEAAIREALKAAHQPS